MKIGASRSSLNKQKSVNLVQSFGYDLITKMRLIPTADVSAPDGGLVGDDFRPETPSSMRTDKLATTSRASLVPSTPRYASQMQGRAEDFRIPGARTFSARENFLSAPGKFLCDQPIFSLLLRHVEFHPRR